MAQENDWQIWTSTKVDTHKEHKRVWNGLWKIPFDTKVEFYTMIIDLSINYGINLDYFSEAIMAFESYQVMVIIGERFVGIYYEDKKFVARAGIDPIEENAINIKMPESLISTYWN